MGLLFKKKSENRNNSLLKALREVDQLETSLWSLIQDGKLAIPLILRSMRDILSSEIQNLSNIKEIEKFMDKSDFKDISKELKELENLISKQIEMLKGIVEMDEKDIHTILDGIDEKQGEFSNTVTMIESLTQKLESRLEENEFKLIAENGYGKAYIGHDSMKFVVSDDYVEYLKNNASRISERASQVSTFHNETNNLLSYKEFTIALDNIVCNYFELKNNYRDIKVMNVAEIVFVKLVLSCSSSMKFEDNLAAIDINEDGKSIITTASIWGTGNGAYVWYYSLDNKFSFRQVFSRGKQ